MPDDCDMCAYHEAKVTEAEGTANSTALEQHRAKWDEHLMAVHGYDGGLD